MSSKEHVVYRFGAFNVDTRRRLLVSAADGTPVSLTPRTYDLLVYLIEHRGEVIDKSALLDAVWRNVVVEENNLTQAISALRRALGERPQEHQYIATVPGRGYQFVAEVLESADSTPLETAIARHGKDAGTLASGAHASTAGPTTETPRRSMLGVLAVIVAAITVTLLVQQFFNREDSTAEPATLRIVGSELVGGTSGGQAQPTFAPDGIRAAFVATVSALPQVFVVNLERGEPRQLTNDPFGATYPGWSPLDDRIVYESGQGGIWSVDPMGTLKPRLVIEDGTSPSVSSDGASIVYEFDSEIRIANVDGSAQRTVSGVPSGDRLFVRARPSPSPDGREIVFFHQQVGPLGDYWIVTTSGGEARQLTFDLHWGGKPAWTADGTHIVFPSRRGGTLTLWSMPASGGEPEPLTAGLGEDSWPTIGTDGSRLLYTTTRVESSFVISHPATLEERILHRSRRLIAFPRISPDGRMIAYFAEIEPREQVMLMSVDGASVEQITEYRANEANVFPRWSADGRTIFYYQNLPPTSLRRITVAGGAFEDVFPEFSWDLNPDLEPDPTGERAAFIRIDPESRQRRLIIRNLRNGDERTLPPGIQFAPSWSKAGDYLLGTAPNRVLLCPANGDECRSVFDGEIEIEAPQSGTPLGHYAQWSADETRVFFTRRTAEPDTLALWVVGRDGENARHVFDYGPVHPLAGRFQVLPDDTILWDRYDYGASELVLATLSRSDD